MSSLKYNENNKSSIISSANLGQNEIVTSFIIHMPLNEFLVHFKIMNVWFS